MTSSIQIFERTVVVSSDCELTRKEKSRIRSQLNREYPGMPIRFGDREAMDHSERRRVWTRDEVLEEFRSSGARTRADMRRRCERAYAAAQRRGWLRGIFIELGIDSIQEPGGVQA